IATVEAFDNSLALDVAMGGSTNTILHTLAIAREAGIEYDIKRIDDISRRVPCICKVSPSSNYHVQDVHRAGGIHTILGEFKRMVRAELAQHKGTQLLIIWQYKGADKKGHCLLRTGRLRQWQISKAYHEYRPAQLKEAQPSGLMPYDSAFRFDAQDCIRT